MLRQVVGLTGPSLPAGDPPGLAPPFPASIHDPDSDLALTLTLCIYLLNKILTLGMNYTFLVYTGIIYIYIY